MNIRELEVLLKKEAKEKDCVEKIIYAGGPFDIMIKAFWDDDEQITMFAGHHVFEDESFGTLPDEYDYNLRRLLTDLVEDGKLEKNIEILSESRNDKPDTKSLIQEFISTFK